MPSAPPPEPARRNRLPVILSCLVFPGLGQMVQRRWLAGVVFAALFTTCLVGLFTSIIVPLYHNLQVALTLAENSGAGGGFRPISIPGVLSWLAAGFVTYLVNALDAYRYSSQQPRS